MCKIARKMHMASMMVIALVVFEILGPPKSVRH